MEVNKVRKLQPDCNCYSESSAITVIQENIGGEMYLNQYYLQFK